MPNPTKDSPEPARTRAEEMIRFLRGKAAELLRRANETEALVKALETPPEDKPHPANRGDPPT